MLTKKGKELTVSLNITTISIFVALLISLSVLANIAKETLQKNLDFPYSPAEKARIEARFKAIEIRQDAIEEHHKQIESKLDLLINHLINA